MNKTSDIVNNRNYKIQPYLHGAIFSRIIVAKNGTHFIIPISFRSSKYNKSVCSKQDFVKFKNVINKLYTVDNNCWITKDETDIKPEDSKMPEICYLIENDSKISKNEFMKLIYFNLLNSKFIELNYLNESKKQFIRGFFESRGSIDYHLNYYTTDYFFDSSNTYDLNRAQIFIDYLSIPLQCLNINLRHLQKEFINGKKRNTQFRINLSWFVNEIGLSHPYRIESLLNNHYCDEYFIENGVTFFNKDVKNKKYNNTFLHRINFYKDNVLGKDLNQKEIDDLRWQLNFDSENNEIGRDVAEKMKVYLMKQDKCSGCCDKYNIEDRSFIKKRDNKYYLEIHHNISFSRDKERLDYYDNMVKLCPVCHLALKKDRSHEIIQKEIIENILKNNADSESFALTYFNLKEHEHKILVDEIFKYLS